MFDSRHVLWTTVALIALSSARARSQTRLGTVEVEADRPADDAPEPDAPPFVTVVDARAPTARTASAGDLIEREAGVHLRSLGGLGAFTAVSIRGSSPNEVAVFLDGIPLNRAGSSSVDLSQLPADALERIEIYRGVPPIELGSQAVGGAINLVSRHLAGPPAWRASVGGGSFGARSASVGYGGVAGGLRFDASAAYHGANGDFSYLDYGSLLSSTDDKFVTRLNNAFNQLALDATVGDAGKGATHWTVAAHGFGKLQGVPSIGQQGGVTHDASLTTTRLVVDAVGEKHGWLSPAIDGRVNAYVGYERAIFRNPDGEPVGSNLPVLTDGETVSFGLTGRALAAVGAHELWTVLASLDGERYHGQDLLDSSRAPAPSTRIRGALAISDDIRAFSDRLALTPAVRLDGVANDLAPGLNINGRNGGGSQVADAFFSPRLGSRYRVARFLTIKGNVGRFVRMPTAVELFGDGAFILPRPSLRPETSYVGDLGFLLDVGEARAPFWPQLQLEGTFFARAVSDYIALLPAANALSALNVGDERFLGVEARARARIGRYLAVALDYTFLDTLNQTGHFFDGSEGKQLPGVPRHKLGARIDLGDRGYRVFYEALYTGDVWRDAENTDGAFIPARTLHSLGAIIGPFHRVPFVLTVEVRNVADLRVVQLPLGGSIHAPGATTPYPLVDLFDYPLPGRAIYATLALQN
jgi:iron complex outermembrane receptor protein